MKKIFRNNEILFRTNVLLIRTNEIDFVRGT